MEDEILTTDEAAAILKVTPQTVRAMLRDGRVRGVRIGREWRLRRLDLERFLETGISCRDQDGET